MRGPLARTLYFGKPKKCDEFSISIPAKGSRKSKASQIRLQEVFRTYTGRHLQESNPISFRFDQVSQFPASSPLHFYPLLLIVWPFSVLRFSFPIFSYIFLNYLLCPLTTCSLRLSAWVFMVLSIFTPTFPAVGLGGARGLNFCHFLAFSTVSSEVSFFPPCPLPFSDLLSHLQLHLLIHEPSEPSRLQNSKWDESMSQHPWEKQSSSQLALQQAGQEKHQKGEERGS